MKNQPMFQLNQKSNLLTKLVKIMHSGNLNTYLYFHNPISIRVKI